MEIAKRLAAHLATVDPKVDAYTLIGNLCRRTTQHRVRTAFAATSIADLQLQLEAFFARAEKNELRVGEIERVQLKCATTAQP